MFFPKQKDLQQFLSVSNIFGIILITFFHFRSFAKLKREAFQLYYTRFLKMSEDKDVNWLSCRTLHISGINPQERLTSLMQTKLNVFLSKSGSGKVLDINFIPKNNFINTFFIFFNVIIFIHMSYIWRHVFPKTKRFTTIFISFKYFRYNFNHIFPF